MPWRYSGREVRVRVLDNRLEVYDGEVQIASHEIQHASGRIVWLKGQYQGLAERDGIAVPFTYARQVEQASVEVRPLSVYDRLAGVKTNG